MSVNYALQEQFVAFSELSDHAGVEDERAALKLSHHPDGFVQFSGTGITSGRDDSGQPKGVGLVSWPLSDPVQGPSFGLVIFGIQHYAPAAGQKDEVVFTEADIQPVRGWTSLTY